MNQNHIFVDTNVLIGAYTDRHNDKICLQYIYALQGKKIYTSALSVAQLISVFQKNRKNDNIRKIVKAIQQKFIIIDFCHEDIQEAIDIYTADIEDNIQYVIGKKMDCFYFITNNKKDYTSFNNIHVLTPQRVRNIRK